MGARAIAVSMAALVEARPLHQPVKRIIIPLHDDVGDAETDLLGHAEGQSFMIEYIDTEGQASRRRITVYDIVAGHGGIPCLRARCHERQATRQFRVDRIQCCIDFDGEVHDDVPEFMAETFGMPLWVARLKETEESKDRWTSIVALMRNDAVLLSALARIDGTVKSSEVDEAVDHLARIIEKNGIFLTEAEVYAIKAYIRRLRPNSDAISRSLMGIRNVGADHVQRFLITAKKVIEADAILHSSEITLINDIARDLIGIELT